MDFKTEYAKQDCDNAAKAEMSTTISNSSTKLPKYGSGSINF